MKKQNFTRQEVIELIDEILSYPDQLTDAITNEYTNYGGRELLELAEESLSETKVVNEKWSKP